MNKVLSLTLVGAILLAFAAVLLIQREKNQISSFETDQDLQVQWNSFKQTFGKKYSDPDYEQYRIQIFSKNLQVIKQDSTFGITQFMDLSPQEFKTTYLTLKTNKNFKVSKNDTPLEDDVEIDWVSKGAVTPVKDQGQCGSCWSFSATGGMEGAIFVKTQDLVSLSEQYLVDCSKNGNEGCNGGLMDNAFTYASAHGIPTEQEYPYKAVGSKCKSKTGENHITSFKDVIQGDCNDLLNSLKSQPVSIAVDANNFQFYTSGVFNKCQTELDHGVLLVGYSSSGNYWKVKNSWGTSWGEKGFIRLQAGNTCGLCNQASYPIA